MPPYVGRHEVYAEASGDFERVRLILTRQRRLGAEFEKAWKPALGALDTPRESEAAEKDRDGVSAAPEVTPTRESA